jgi:hypothetical protein
MRTLTPILLWFPMYSWGCGTCAGIVEPLIYGQNFAINLIRMLIPIASIFAIAFAIHHFADRADIGSGDG